MEKKYTRVCPNCQELVYHSLECNAKTASEANRLCRKCNGTKWAEKYSGANNHFYGEKHSKETLKKIKKTKEKSNYAAYKTPEFREKMRIMATENNPMKGRSFYSVWIEKYGKEEADKKMDALKKRHRQNALGEGNNMFGKPSPNGSGNGWKGHYKAVFFRSLRELMFLIHLIDNNIKYTPLENKEYGVKYVDCNGQTRTYFGDFLVEDRWIEIKPLRLQSSPNNQLKQAAAKEFCRQNDYIFEYLDPEIDFKLIQAKFLSKEIVFLPKSEERFRNFKKE